jgi:hypothetical protein
MHKGYSKYTKKIGIFKEEIYFYCDYNIGSEIMIPAFINLWPEGKKEIKGIPKRDLVVITSNILHDLVDKQVLEVIHKKDPCAYAFYRVLPHEFLLDHNNFIDKQKMLKFKL